MVPSFDKNKTVNYSLEADTGDVKTIFHLGVLDAKSEAHLNTAYSVVEYRNTGAKDEHGDPKVDAIAKIDKDGRDLETVALGLKAIDNFGAARLTFTEKIYPFGRRQILTDDALDLVKPYVAELAKAIRDENQFTVDDSKN